MDAEKIQQRCCCCCNQDLLTCLCELTEEIDCVKQTVGPKQFRRLAKEKLLTCIILQEINKLDQKLDQILAALNNGN